MKSVAGELVGAADGGFPTDGAVAQAARASKGTAPPVVRIREVRIEARLKAGVEKLGGMCEKFISPGKRGVPDRIVSFPFGIIDFVELKAKGGRLSAAQKMDHLRRQRLGYKVHVLWTPEQVDAYLGTIEKLLSLSAG